MTEKNTTPVGLHTDPDTGTVTITTDAVGLAMLGLSATLTFALTSPVNTPFNGIARRFLQEGGIPTDALDGVMAHLYVFSDGFSDMAMGSETTLAMASVESFVTGDRDV